MQAIHLHTIQFLAVISFVSLHLKDADALLQSGITSTTTCCNLKENLSEYKCPIFKEYPTTKPESVCWAFEHNLDSKHAKTHSLFCEVASHLRLNTQINGSRASCLPFLIQRDGDHDDDNSEVPIIKFSSDDLKLAIESDYLDACIGKDKSSKSNDSFFEGENNNGQGGWRMERLDSTSHSWNEHSFQSNRLHWDAILAAKSTIVFNSAGAYISSQLASTSLAALHGLCGIATGVCLNLYITKAANNSSAPPHTDKQDVVVIQTQGRKRWRVYSPPDSTMKHNTDPFCRGKGDDKLSVSMLSDEASELLLDVTLLPGDVLYLPARFPHTTDTLNCYQDDDHQSDTHTCSEEKKESIHLTLGLDTHVWDMNYMSMRTLALRRFGLHDILLDSTNYTNNNDDMNKYKGMVNQLSCDLREGLLSSLDMSRIDETTHMANNLAAYNDRVNVECATDTKLTLDQCLETVIHFNSIWDKIEITHNDMYTAAIQEERTRKMENGGWRLNVGDTMTEKRANRLSIFRVPIFFEQLDNLRQEHQTWGETRQMSNDETSMPNLFEGDQVEANLLDTNVCNSVVMAAEENISWSFAKVIKVRDDGQFNLQLFDGTVKNGVGRHNIKGPHGLGIFI